SPRPTTDIFKNWISCNQPTYTYLNTNSGSNPRIKGVIGLR
ncbi:7118_t:CDS:1, partial [Gigaspora rosea]